MQQRQRSTTARRLGPRAQRRLTRLLRKAGGAQGAWGWARKHNSRRAVLVVCAGLLIPAFAATAEQNLLKNPGFEEGNSQAESVPNWVTVADSASKARLTEEEAHTGHKAIAIPANTAIEQKVDSLDPGAYLARGWIKSEAEQYVTFLLRNPERPWAAYACAEIRVPRGQWTRLEVFCPLDQRGALTLTLGGMSKEFHLYHGTAQDMTAPIIADDFELVRYQGGTPAPVTVWDATTTQGAPLDWSARSGWARMSGAARSFVGTPVIESGPLAGVVRQSDGALVVYSVADGTSGQRCAIVPSPALPSGRCSSLQENNRTGIRVSSDSGDRFYTAWFTANGLIQH